MAEGMKQCSLMQGVMLAKACSPLNDALLSICPACSKNREKFVFSLLLISSMRFLVPV